MAEWKAKRFWDQATVTPCAEGWQILLDDRPVRTPGKLLLSVPTQGLAEAIAAEWNAQEGEIAPLTMPFTRAANSAIERVTPQREAVADMLAAYGGTDLLCYRAEAPEALVARQATAWDPLIEWAAETFGARLRVGTGVMHIKQDPDVVQNLARDVYAADAFTLTALHDLITISGSLVLAAACVRGRLDADSAWAASRIDEVWQAEQWGADDEAVNVAAQKYQAFINAAQMFDLLTIN